MLSSMLLVRRGSEDFEIPDRKHGSYPFSQRTLRQEFNILISASLKFHKIRINLRLSSIEIPLFYHTHVVGVMTGIWYVRASGKYFQLQKHVSMMETIIFYAKFPMPTQWKRESNLTLSDSKSSILTTKLLYFLLSSMKFKKRHSMVKLYFSNISLFHPVSSDVDLGVIVSVV